MINSMIDGCGQLESKKNSIKVIHEDVTRRISIELGI